MAIMRMVVDANRNSMIVADSSKHCLNYPKGKIVKEKQQLSEEIKPGQYLSIKTPQGETLEGKVLSIIELKSALWISIKTHEGIRTTSLSY